MDDLAAEHFREFFQDVHQVEPFPWQSRLAAQVLRDGRWPDVIDLPTGTGKTAILDVAIFALAAQPERFPRRVVFVIDRRIVVDQVYQRATAIKNAIENAETPTLGRLRSRLAAVAEGPPLGVAMLRGGIPIDRDWAQCPDQPWVMVSTVDQFGSRLLFRGYGVRPRMRPIYAGLTGADCLVILDEVHLSTAFADTLKEVGQQHFGESLPLRKFHVVKMSATADATGSTFTLTETDLAGSDELRRRAQAPKTALLREAAGADEPHVAFPAEAQEVLKSELDSSTRTVGIIVNRVRTARETHRELVEGGYVAHLVTGRMRPLDREHKLAEIADIVDPDRHPARTSDSPALQSHDVNGDASTAEALEGLRVVVATQAIEVGADFSFDALISEAAPIDSLRQRFGRLDRRGTLASQTNAPAKAWIVGVSSSLNSKRPDPVYGDTALRTWEELRRLEVQVTGGLLDFGPQSPLLGQLGPDCRARRRCAPLLLPTYMDAWAQTDPEPITQPRVDWFLHGIEEEQRAGDVSVAWRHDRSPEVLRQVPPRSAEFLEVPVDAARAWLAQAPFEVQVADVPAAESHEIEVDAATDADWCRWQGRDEPPEFISTGEIQPGDILIVDPQRGGLEYGTWSPSSNTPVVDLGDEAQAAYGRRLTLRLDHRLFEGHPPPPSPSDESALEMAFEDRLMAWRDSIEPDAGPLGAKSVILERLIDEGLPEPQPVHLDAQDDQAGYYILTSRGFDPGTIDGSDDASSVTGAEVTLRQHLSGVAEKAAEYARRLGLSDELQSDLRLAAQLHDLGKVDSRFQRQMAGGNEVKLALTDEPLAKSLQGVNPTSNGWPPVRHEVMSVAIAESNERILELAHDRDLVLHLVGTHHGAGRPLPQIEEDPASEILRFEHDGHKMEASTDLVDSSLALEMADRFWRLNDRYGYHGLAWLEAILRLADQQRSAEEASGQGVNPP